MSILRRSSFRGLGLKNKKMEAVARLRNYPTSPRKMRLLADLIRGMEVENALNTLKFSTKDPSVPMEKLLVSAIANWKVKNEGVDVAEANLYVKTIFVDGGRVLKRMRPAPQGRAYRVRKRSNHITLIVDSRTAAATSTNTENANIQA